MNAAIKCCVFTMFVACAAPILAGQPACRNEIVIDLHPTTTFEEGSKKGCVAIIADRKHVEIGKPFRVTISVTNLGNAVLPIRNPRITGILVRHVKLAWFDAEGRFIADLFVDYADGIDAPSLHHLSWRGLRPKATCDVTYTFVAGTRFSVVKPLFPPGEYKIQLVVDRRFASDSPMSLPYLEWGTDPTSKEYFEYLGLLQKLTTEARENGESLRRFEEGWKNANPPGELVRSNVVTITFLPTPVEAPNPKQ